MADSDTLELTGAGAGDPNPGDPNPGDPDPGDPNPGDAGPGDTVRARRRVWRVMARCSEPAIRAAISPAVTRFDLQPEPLAGAGRVLLAPFDRIERLDGADRLARVSRRRAVHRLASMVAAAAPLELPAAVAAAPVRLLPFQLEPLLALRRGLAARVLIADHVGLGKTIQAALIARDLVAANVHAAILILTPAGLRDQWRDELRDRAALTASIVDHDVLHARATTLPPHVNPWRLASRVIASIDFVKQADVLHGLRRLTWDLLIVDEAHTLTLGSDRLAAAETLARQSDRLVLLTATPHDGREDSFRALCDLGRASNADVLALFRRTRATSGATHRRITRRLVVRPTSAERHVHALLERYARRVWHARPSGSRETGARSAARLAMTVLFKRAASSATSLAQSLERRRALLFDEAGPGSRDPIQVTLPLAPDRDTAAEADDDAPRALLAAPGLEPDQERTWLNLLVHAAQAAARDESKVRALVRLLRRSREPVIVFTEYRDTLARLEGVLARLAPTVTMHGGRSDEARRDALRAFNSGAARVLLATDAASVGLNLQSRCRFVVHVELPWSPTRLEQRIGRVDRLGQTRTVHSLHLVADAPLEAAIEARLMVRAQRIRDAIDSGPDGEAEHTPIDCLGDALDPSANVRGTERRDERADDDRRHAQRREAGIIWPQLRDEAEGVADVLERMRRLQQRSEARAVRRRRRGQRSPFVARLSRSRRRRPLPRGEIHVYRTRVTRADGAMVESTLTAVHVDTSAHRATRATPSTAAPAVPSSATQRVVDDVVARRLEARCIELASELDRTEALVRVRRREADARAHARPAQVQLPLFAELVPPSVEENDSTPDPRLRGEGPAELRSAARLAGVLIVD